MPAALPAGMRSPLTCSYWDVGSLPGADIQDKVEAQERPVGLSIDRTGTLLVPTKLAVYCGGPHRRFRSSENAAPRLAGIVGNVEQYFRTARQIH